jgi:hypothetical protein
MLHIKHANAVSFFRATTTFRIGVMQRHEDMWMVWHWNSYTLYIMPHKNNFSWVDSQKSEDYFLFFILRFSRIDIWVVCKALISADGVNLHVCYGEGRQRPPVRLKFTISQVFVLWCRCAYLNILNNTDLESIGYPTVYFINGCDERGSSSSELKKG